MSSGGQFYGDKATKVAYQDVTILSKSGPMYVIRVTEQVAEEIVHMQATSGAQFSMALRADVDDRPVDLAQLGATMNMIIQRYGLPIPQVYPQVGQTIPVGPAPGTPVPLPSAVAPWGAVAGSKPVGQRTTVVSGSRITGRDRLPDGS